MKKTILTIVMALLCLNIAFTQTTVIKAKVTDEQGKPLSGVTIAIKGSANKTITDSLGTFILRNFQNGQILVLSHLGYRTKELNYKQIEDIILLEMSQHTLEEINIVSTGYQTVPKERSTGAFTHIDNRTINRNVGVNVLDRLEGVTSGLLLNRGLPTNGRQQPKLTVHGRTTLFANAEPLIVLDGFPYEGTIDQINAADIETIDILKDAAAASIWGTRASNGVIVLTSKKGRKNQKMLIELSSTLTIQDKPDIYYIPKISSSDFINLEEYLFSKGFFNSNLNRKYAAVSPAVEIFNSRKLNLITSADSAAQINMLKAHDVRSDLEKYAYRRAVYQQYQLNIRGGSENNRYYLSGGYDKNSENSITNSYDRLTLNANNTYTLFKNRLEIMGGLNFTASNTKSKSGPYLPYTPYDRLTDAQGNSLSVVTNSTLRMTYIDTAGHGKLLDWHYRPKDEFKSNTLAKRIQYKINLGIDLKIIEGLNLTGNYQYLKENYDTNRDYDLNSFYTRDLINRYSKIIEEQVITGIPMGGIRDGSETDISSKSIRMQLNFSKKFQKDHEITAIAGYEGNDIRIKSNTQTIYGYDLETMNNGNDMIDPSKYYSYYYSPGSSQQISTAPTFSGRTNITQSFYSNISYAYKSRYIISASARKDESNLFGVKTNQKGVPLWSTGLAWIINREDFYNLGWIPSLKIRATYGYNGNIDKTVSGYLTVVNYGLINEWGSIYSQVQNPPNASLRWERVKTWNIGLDFGLANSRITGSLDLYRKDAKDLIGNSPIAMQSGVTQFKGNSANVTSNGADLLLSSKNITGNFRWSTTFLLNYVKDKVTNYKIKQSSNLNIVTRNYDNPLEGYPYYAIFSFPSAGLDATGSPQGYLNGNISNNYSSITRLLDPSQIKYHGSASPKYFGSLINTFNYRNFELSINLVYKLDYYFRRQSVFSGSNFDYAATTDYDKRWQNPGDESTTRVPSLVYPNNSQRATFFQNSEDLIERGDHIRLQDIRLSYQIPDRFRSALKMTNASLFLYAKNLGILWKKSSLNLDPDYGTATIPQSLSISFGVNLNF